MRRTGLALLAGAALCASAVPAWSGDADSRAPVAALSVSPQPVVAGEGAVLDGSGSRDPDGSVVRYAWDLDGDGSFEKGGGAEAQLAHVFEEAGSFTVGLRVVDATGESADATETVTVEAKPEPAAEPEPSPKAAARPEDDRAAPRERTRAASEPSRAAAEQGKPEKRAKPRAQRVQAAANTTVSIRDFSFAPRTVTISPGDTVTWRNTGEEPHTATGSGFDTGTLRPGQNGSHTFQSAGTFSYKCQPHPFMTGTVRVVAAGSGGGSGSSGGGTQGAQNDGAGTGDDDSASDGDDSLPSTGLALGSVVLTGLAMIAAGVALRRRVTWPAA